MATIGPVDLSIFNQPSGVVGVQLSYEIAASGDDLETGQTYRELIELIGVDAGEPGEDGVNEVIDMIGDGIVTFDSTQPRIQRSPEKFYRPPAAELDEDSHPFFPRDDEIRARVTLMPTRESNVIRRQEIVGPTG